MTIKTVYNKKKGEKFVASFSSHTFTFIRIIEACAFQNSCHDDYILLSLTLYHNLYDDDDVDDDDSIVVVAYR